MNLSEFIDEDNATFQQFDVNVTEQPQWDEDLFDLYMYMLDVRRTLNYVICYICLVLGVPGNILSAIIWLRRHVISKNSSALYLAVLAINDLLHLLNDSVRIHMVPWTFDYDSWVFLCYNIIDMATGILEPLLVLSFSVERFIAISCPLQVHCVYYTLML